MVKVRKGFTLIELIIVMVIIGILAAALLLSSSSATATADATAVITELRNLKAAAMMFYMDSMDFVDSSAFTLGSAPAQAAKDFLSKYMDNLSKITGSGLYAFADKDGYWYVGYDMGTTNKKSNLKEVKEKLAGRAKSTGLWGTDAIANAPTYPPTVFTTGDSAVWMVAK